MELLFALWIWLTIGAGIYALAGFLYPEETSLKPLDVVWGVLIAPLAVVFMPVTLLYVLYKSRE